jgi:hypothetical protein
MIGSRPESRFVHPSPTPGARSWRWAPAAAQTPASAGAPLARRLAPKSRRSAAPAPPRAHRCLRPPRPPNDRCVPWRNQFARACSPPNELRSAGSRSRKSSARPMNSSPLSGASPPGAPGSRPGARGPERCARQTARCPLLLGRPFRLKASTVFKGRTFYPVTSGSSMKSMSGRPTFPGC